ncbi:cytochrome c maturation protein CcmE [Mangrovivirga sp. M17]|uniref:Cytochrome c maturation protein CcmE n=1 Tax=Mangrovivirga halotolerans TaxID=2993936 RepID=A0ABT3RS39_9BACT|nr:cytochrome c maturation protein CcmE [Mangrovivirga halotolerans]MCX2744605.1 cytochrome c maturation protein CcmE [Mangrovivirga halotolerans]
MKKQYIFILVIVAAVVAFIFATSFDAGSYVTFNEAKELADNGSEKQYHVVGELKKDASGEVIGIHPSPDKLSFSFTLVDDNKEERQVFYNEPMPQDFMKSEKVVVVGSFRQNVFVADQILMKCPSKYQEENLNPNAQL